MKSIKDHRHGCFNRPPLVDFYYVGDFWLDMVKIPNNNSKDCQYSKTTIDHPHCEGCVRKFDPNATTPVL